MFKKSPNFNLITSIKSIGVSKLKTNITHQNLKSRLPTTASYGTASFTKMETFLINRYKYLVLGREGLLVEETLWFEEQEHWRRHHQDSRVCSCQHFRGLRGKYFPTDNRHFNGRKLCPYPGRHIHTILVLRLQETVSFSVQLDIEIHRWRIVHL